MVVTSLRSRFSGKVEEKSDADQIGEYATNEKILKSCHDLYTEPEKGLIKIANELSIKLTTPRKKITVLLLGNHSAGKSTFINWYTEEHIQKTGVAIETQGFYLVTNGKKRESLGGPATLQLYPHLQPLTAISGVLDFLSTEVSTSKQKRFSLVTFIDTPGLVDGDMNYPFDVNEALHWMGGLADLIFVFFDPIGQALCKRTLDIVEKLNIAYASKVRLYLSKIDLVQDEADRQKVMMQIVQELCKRQGLNRNAFDMPCIFIPDAELKQNTCVNEIHTVCLDIERTIAHTVQNTLNTLEKDANYAKRLINHHLTVDKENVEKNNSTIMRGIMFGIIPFIVLLNLVVTSVIGKRVTINLIGKDSASLLFIFLAPVQSVLAVFPNDFPSGPLFIFIMIASIVYAYKKWTFQPTMSGKQKKHFMLLHNYLENEIKPKKNMLYKEYLEQCIGGHDL